ncbi:MAG: helix-hairpin-helix domain-containing protein [Acidobacteriota bacterium]|nr:helix-hairpin-helix domain-containing protein [Acidobacteriota bacterium]
MKIAKRCKFNSCKLPVKLFPLLICCLPLVCCQSENTKQFSPVENRVEISQFAVNINTSSAEELEKLPHIGAQTARKIVEFRNKNGKFRKPEHLLLIDGIGDARFREMRNFIKVE